MARPERNSVDYFPFICEDGKKMFYIEQTYGNDGFAVFVKILRELAKTEYHYLNLSDNNTFLFISAKCRVSKELLTSIIEDLVTLGKFDSILWSENKIIWCQDFIDSIQDAYKKRNNECITFDGLISLLIGLGVRKPLKQSSQEPVKPQSILKYSKEKEMKENNIPELSVFLAYGKEKEPTVNLKSLERKYESWVINGWKDGNDKKITNWKSKLLNTLPFIDKNTTTSHSIKIVS